MSVHDTTAGIQWLGEELDRLRAENERLEAENARLRAGDDLDGDELDGLEGLCSRCVQHTLAAAAALSAAADALKACDCKPEPYKPDPRKLAS